MNIEDLIKKYESLEGVWNANGAEIARQCFLRDLEQLNKIDTKKVTVPQSVAEWIEKGKKELSLRDLMSSSYTSTEVGNWLGELDEDGGFKNQETFARAVLDGYTVEKEKRYYVRFKGMESDDFNYLNFIKFQHAWVLSSIKLDKKFRTEHTKKQLEEAGFGWVFDCEGIEVKEVE